jgi:predicted permease
MIRRVLESLARLADVLRKRKLDADFDEEIATHIELLTEENIGRGMSADEAHRQAMLRLGGLAAVRNIHRDARGFPVLERFLQTSWLDFKLGIRMMLKYPGLSLTGVVGMGVAIAIGTGIFAVFQATLFPSIPLDEGDRLVGIENWDTETRNQDYHSLHDFLAWRAELRSVEEIGAFHARSSNLIKADGTVEQVRVVEINPGGLRTAHIEPLMGRLLTDEDDKPGSPDVAIISHQMWQRQFDADPTILGMTVRLGPKSHTIVGVMPPGFAFPVNDNLWIPLRANPLAFERGGGPELFIFGRIAPGFTRDSAQAELTQIGIRTASDFPETSRLKPRIVPYSALFFDDVAMAEFLAAQFMVIMLLVVVFGNVAILIYARTASRHSEIAVRTALGASRRRIVSQLFVEALVLTSVAAVFGLTLIKIAAQEGKALFAGEAGDIPFWIDFSLSFQTILVTLAFTILAAVIAGVVPALKATSRNVERQLRQLEGGARMQLGRTWTALIIVQVAVVVAILPGAIFNAWQAYGTFEPGFPVVEFVGARLGLDGGPAQSTELLKDLQNRLLERIKAEPDVVGVTGGSIPGKEQRITVEIEGTDGRPRMARFTRVDSNFFDVFGVRTLMGQSLAQTVSDTAVVVNRAFVDDILGGTNPLGRRVRYVTSRRNGTDTFVVPLGVAVPQTQENDGWYEITGVVDNLPAKTVQSDETAARI